eukprot:Phypoly_transcript_15930.p1 GENE.Phypoly_transcript_15930~~Phypoly_transcript_15930.p1  ORF type:complete len:262 (+),score=32.99 Phypoly_transcript_15930:62-847(+)
MIQDASNAELQGKFLSKLYKKFKPHITLINDVVVFAKFVNTSYSILVLLHPDNLILCEDANFQSVQIPAPRVNILCDPVTSHDYLYEAYLYTFVFNIFLFLFIIYLSRWHPFKKHADIISIILVVFTLFMMLAKIFMVFYVLIMQIYFECNVATFPTHYCTDVMIQFSGVEIDCAQFCEVAPNPELFLLGSTLLLSFLYLCFLIYTYYDACKTLREQQTAKVVAADTVGEIAHEQEEEDEQEIEEDENAENESLLRRNVIK